MKSERVFLMELFLDEKLPKEVRTKIKDRFAEMDEPPRVGLNIPGAVLPTDIQGGFNKTYHETPQSPSMQRIMAQNPDLVKPPQPVTPAAAQALAARQALLQNAGNEKPENGRKSPRKI